MIGVALRKMEAASMLFTITQPLRPKTLSCQIDKDSAGVEWVISKPNEVCLLYESILLRAENIVCIV
jgi:hypothetical protein